MVISPVEPSAMKPLPRSRHAVNDRKKTRNGIAFLTIALLIAAIRSPSSMVLERYISPSTLARKITVKPRSRFTGLTRASRPCHPEPQVTLEKRSRVKSEPVKKVATATPIRKGPRHPLIKRKVSNTLVPKTLDGFERYSYATACMMKLNRIAIHTQYAPPKLVA